MLFCWVLELKQLPSLEPVATHIVGRIPACFQWEQTQSRTHRVCPSAQREGHHKWPPVMPQPHRSLLGASPSKPTSVPGPLCPLTQPPSHCDSCPSIPVFWIRQCEASLPWACSRKHLDQHVELWGILHNMWLKGRFMSIAAKQCSVSQKHRFFPQC